jgi:hypothetical protein
MTDAASVLRVRCQEKKNVVQQVVSYEQRERDCRYGDDPKDFNFPLNYSLEQWLPRQARIPA